VNAKSPAKGVINSTASAACKNTPDMSFAPGCSDNGCNGQLFQCLLEKIDTQQKVIDNLLQKLNSVLKFLGIQEETVMNYGNGVPQQPSGFMSQSQGDMASSQHTATDEVTDTSGSSNDVNVPSYANIASRSGPFKDRQPRNLSDVVMSAIHKDQVNKDRRSKSVIVNGLPVSSGVSDKEHFRRLCSLEFGIEPNIVYARRLGTSSLSSANHVKPVLIALRTADEASILISHSKSVDRATNVAMRTVFINPNLSKDEAKAAYCYVCHRAY